MSKKPTTMYEIGSPLEDFKAIINSNFGLKFTTNIVEQRQKYNVQEALQSLESIDNANPSEAMENLENYLFNEWKQNHVNFGCDYKLEAELDKQLNNLKSIKQYILKAQEQERENARNEEILQKYYQEGITLDSVRALKKERDNYKRVLEIIKEKNVDIKHLKWCINNPKKLTTPLLNYNIDMNENEQLTEKEYDLLKRWVG